MDKKQVRNILLIKKWIKDFIFITVGCIVMAIGTSLFLLPNKLSSGGLSGVSTIIYYLFGLPLGTTMLILNIPLFIMAFIKVGRQTTIKGLIGTILLSVFIDFFERYEPLTEDRILACIYGGICVGIGTAIVLKAHASTGGTDMLSYIIRSYHSHFRAGSLIVIIDTMIVLLNVLVFQQIEIGLYSAIAIYVMGKMIDIIFEGIYFTKSIFIVSNEYKAIAKEIGEKLDRGSTAIYAKGMYTKQKKMMLWCVGSRTEAARIKEIAKQIDSQSFIVISNAREAWGKGFK